MKGARPCCFCACSAANALRSAGVSGATECLHGVTEGVRLDRFERLSDPIIFATTVIAPLRCLRAKAAPALEVILGTGGSESPDPTGSQVVPRDLSRSRGEPAEAGLRGAGGPQRTRENQGVTSNIRFVILKFVYPAHRYAIKITEESV